MSAAAGTDRGVVVPGALTWPCGACLQVALELGGPALTVVVSDLHGATATARLSDLAPRLPHKG